MTKGGKNSQDAIVAAVLALILRETDLEYDAELNRDTLVQILTAYGEVHWSEEVIDEMMASCRRHADDDAPVRLNEATFLRALTSDIREKYDTMLEQSPTTLYDDVVQARAGTDFHRIYTASNIDYVADTFRSLAWQVAAWFTALH